MYEYPKPIQKRISLTVDEELYDELRTLATRSQRTLPKYIRHALKLHLYIVTWLSR